MKTCKFGHEYEVVGKGCPVCCKERKQAWREANRDYKRAWREAHREANYINNGSNSTTLTTYQITLKNQPAVKIPKVAGVKTDADYVHLLDSAGNILFSFNPAELQDLRKITPVKPSRKSCRQLNEVDKQKILSLRSEGMFYRQISETLGFAPMTVMKICNRANKVSQPAQF